MSSTILVEAVYPHPPEKVWRALTDSRALSQWLMENDFEPRVGHRFQFRMKPQPGFDGIVHCEVLQLLAPKRLEFTWVGGPLQSRVAFTLEAVAEGTRLRIEHSGFDSIKAKILGLIMRGGWGKMVRTKIPAVLERMRPDGTLADAAAPCGCSETKGLVATVLGVLPDHPRNISATRVVSAGVLGGIVVFACNAISWMGLPFHTAALHTLPDADGIVQRMASRGAASGVYLFPGLPPAGANEAEKAALFDKYARGPRITMMVYRADGGDPRKPTKYVAGLGVNVVAGLLVAVMLALLSGVLPRFGQRVLFVALLGVFAALTSNVESWLWWSYPSEFGALMVADVVVSWVIGGVIISALLGAPRSRG